MKDPFHQMKKLINKVDIELEKRAGEPVSQREVWYELRVNHRNYDDEEIIDVAEPEKIIWNAYTGSKKEMKYSTFKKTSARFEQNGKTKKNKITVTTVTILVMGVSIMGVTLDNQCIFL